MVSKSPQNHLKIPFLPFSKGDEFIPDFSKLNSNLLNPKSLNQWITYKYSVHNHIHLKNTPRKMFSSVLVYINSSTISTATCLDHIQSVIDDMQTIGYRPTEEEFKLILSSVEKVGLFKNPKLLLNSVNQWGIKDWNHEFKGQSLLIFMTLLIKRAVSLADKSLFRAAVVYCHEYMTENNSVSFLDSDQQFSKPEDTNSVPGLFKELLELILDSSIALNVDILDIYQKCDRLKIDIPYRIFQKTVFHLQSLMQDPFGFLGELDDLLRPRKRLSNNNTNVSKTVTSNNQKSGSKENVKSYYSAFDSPSLISASIIQNQINIPRDILNLESISEKHDHTELPRNTIAQSKNLELKESTEMTSLVRQLLQIFITKEYVCPFIFKSLLLSCFFQKQFIEADILWSYSTLFKKQYIYKISISTEHVLIYTKTLLVQKRLDEVVHLYKRHFATMSVKRRRDSALHFIFLKFFLINSHLITLDAENNQPCADKQRSMQSGFYQEVLTSSPNIIAYDYLENIESVGIRFKLDEMIELRKLIEDEASSEILSRMACSI